MGTVCWSCNWTPLPCLPRRQTASLKSATMVTISTALAALFVMITCVVATPVRIPVTTVLAQRDASTAPAVATTGAYIVDSITPLGLNPLQSLRLLLSLLRRPQSRPPAVRWNGSVRQLGFHSMRYLCTRVNRRTPAEPPHPSVIQWGTGNVLIRSNSYNLFSLRLYAIRLLLRTLCQHK